jgi:WD40 repeat protein
MQVFAGHTAPVQCGVFTPDGKRIVSADAEGTLLFWDPRAPAPLFKLAPHDPRFELGGITALAVNAASTLAVVGGAAGGVRVVSLSTGKVVGALGGHADRRPRGHRCRCGCGDHGRDRRQGAHLGHGDEPFACHARTQGIIP